MEASYLVVMLLFLVAGMLVGGTWSAYKNSSKAMTLIMAVLAAVAIVSAFLVMLEVVDV